MARLVERKPGTRDNNSRYNEQMAELRRISFGERPLLSREAVLAEAIFVDILRVANALGAGFDELFRKFGLTSPQYNALRVLREARECGMPCQELGASLVARDPDITRMADRLEEHGFIEKRRSETDRRVVLLSLTLKGLRVLADLEGPVTELHLRQAATLTASEQGQLSATLGKLLGCNPD